MASRVWQHVRRTVLQALMHAREFPLGLINVDDPRDLTLSPPLQAPRHRLAGPPSTWLTGDWQGTISSLTVHPGHQGYSQAHNTLKSGIRYSEKTFLPRYGFSKIT